MWHRPLECSSCVPRMGDGIVGARGRPKVEILIHRIVVSLSVHGWRWPGRK